MKRVVILAAMCLTCGAVAIVANSEVATTESDEQSSLLQVRKKGTQHNDSGDLLRNINFKVTKPCPSHWEDTMHFDCQLYEGANWCTSSGGLGYGWCHSSQKCDQTPFIQGGYALQEEQYDGWGGFDYFTDAAHPLTAAQVCSRCGADCPPTKPTRPLNPISASCQDYPASHGKIWRGPSGYSCAAYHYGGFCRKNANGIWHSANAMEGYGALADYKNLASDGVVLRLNLSPLEACCSCGGGCDCTNGWMPPSGSVCAREFVYQGNAYSGCTTVDSSSGKGWCSHTVDYQGHFSECSACAAGWNQPAACVGKFTYKGKTYSGCTTVGHSTAWCAHTATYDDNHWSECVPCKSAAAA